MMLLADFPEMTIAGKHLGAAQWGHRPRNGIVLLKDDGGGNHVTSTFDDGAPAWATPRRQKLQPDHLYSSTLIREMPIMGGDVAVGSLQSAYRKRSSSR